MSRCLPSAWGALTIGMAVSVMSPLPQVQSVRLSNTALPLDTTGRSILTGETDVIYHSNAWFFYVNSWGGCRPVDCCGSSGGCASCCYVPPTRRFPDECVFTANHTVYVYRTTDLAQWELLGAALTPGDRPPGIEFRPHVVYNPGTALFVMWFENRPSAIVSKGYTIATSPSPEGPFTVVRTEVAVADTPGDFDLLEVNGTAYHVQTTTNDPQRPRDFVVTVLDANFTGPSATSATFTAPLPAEGPVFFQRGDVFFILAGTTCCACRGGSSVYVFAAPTPLGPYTYHGDVGTNHTTAPYDVHSPYNYITRAQASVVISVPTIGGGISYLWLGNQWVTSDRRDSDLLFWAVLNFPPNNTIRQLEWHDSTEVDPLVRASPRDQVK